jgi:hypothetical protein
MVTPANRAHRLPGALVAVGALVFLAASFTPVGGDVYSAEGASEVAAALEGARGTWNAANLVSAVGVVVAAVGLFLLGRNLRRGGQQLRTRRAARIVTLLGLATAIEAVLLVWNATASIDSLATTYGDPTGSALLITLGLAWTLAALAVFIGLGLALLWFPHQRWLGWLVLVLGPVATILMSAFAGPDPAYLLLLICGITLWVSPPPAPQ